MPKRTAAPYPAPRKAQRQPRAGNPMLAGRGVQKRTASVLRPFARSKRAYRDEYLLRAPSLAEVEEIRAGQLSGGSLPGVGLSGGVLPGPRAQIYGIQEPGLIDRYRRSIREAENRRAPGLAPGTSGPLETSDAQVEADAAAVQAAAEGQTPARLPAPQPLPGNEGEEEFATPARRLFTDAGGLPGDADFTPNSKLALAEKGFKNAVAFQAADGTWQVSVETTKGLQTLPAAFRNLIGGDFALTFKFPGISQPVTLTGSTDFSLAGPKRKTYFTQDDVKVEVAVEPETGMPLEVPVATMASGSRPEDLGTRSIGGVETPAVPPSSDVSRFVSEIISSVVGGRPDVAVVQRNGNMVRVADSATQTEAVVMFGPRNIVVLPPGADAITRANTLRIANEQALLQGGRKVIVAPGFELQPAIQKIVKRLQRASSQSYINRNPSGGFLVYKPGGNQVLAAVPAAKSRLEELNDSISVRRATRITPRDILAEVRVQQFAESIRQRRIGPPAAQFEDAGVRRQFAGGSAGASMQQDWRESRSSDRQRYLGGR